VEVVSSGFVYSQLSYYYKRYIKTISNATIYRARKLNIEATHYTSTQSTKYALKLHEFIVVTISPNGQYAHNLRHDTNNTNTAKYKE
jgi:hypothetical protein